MTNQPTPSALTHNQALAIIGLSIIWCLVYPVVYHSQFDLIASKASCEMELQHFYDTGEPPYPCKLSTTPPCDDNN